MNVLSKPMDILLEQEVEYIHKYSLKLLEKVGMLIRDEDILKLLQKAHCDVNFSTQVARIKPGVVEDALKEVPHHVKLYGRNQKNDIPLEDFTYKIEDNPPFRLEGCLFWDYSLFHVLRIYCFRRKNKNRGDKR